ncbi:MAG TPA: hypothetical protein DCS07_11470 [Bdellovibrionales bacterium]|nr:MAG: hypothetical protein A2X97_05425 [Bdellovibrionales bacterium GWA1_52_35]OFZ40277.1 MAG: hypothetical protein A2070_06985 [Bdellovibrionales bacterium GWC1_52_8]HAR43228.1 hypothetical protein [Bdellovibrionales bacterium]HCM40969.1 hypothetical protein [Bdellovibrionales bacterium]
MLLSAIGLGACSSTNKSNQNTAVKMIHQLVPYSLHVRRPAVPGADPNVGPGGPDYQTQPLPNERFDCEPYSDLLKEISIDGLRACLSTMKSEAVVTYQMKRPPAPFYELQKGENVPPCLLQELPKIPLPREVVFESNEEGFMGCYSSRLDLEADELLWVKVPKARTVLNLTLPTAFAKARTDEEVRLLFLSWMLTPFYDSQRFIPSRVVPDVLCTRCIGEKNMSNASKSPIVLWP